MKTRATLTILSSVGILVLGMAFLVAISAPKFGTFRVSPAPRDLRDNLGDLQRAEVVHHATSGRFVAVLEPYPATEDAPWGTGPGGSPFEPLGWEREGGTLGQYWVGVADDGADFTAHGTAGGEHYVVHATGEPERWAGL
ncbi:MAG: hypothetical protein Q8P18_24500 [Pseudomonadota bacterium]|nr:hypothetical protein [Pseudomonadota bacterium]